MNLPFFRHNRYRDTDPHTMLSSPAVLELDLLADEALRTAQSIKDTVAKLRAQDTAHSQNGGQGD